MLKKIEPMKNNDDKQPTPNSTPEKIEEEAMQETAEDAFSAAEIQDSQEDAAEYNPDLCALCQEKERAEGSFYCEDCRIKMLKNKIKGGPVFAVILSIILSFAAVILLSFNFYQAMPFIEGEKQLSQGYANTAANNITKVEELNKKLNATPFAMAVNSLTDGQQLFPAGKAPNIFVAKVYAKAYSVLQAGEYLMQMVGDDNVMKDPAYIPIRKYLKEYQIYAKTSEVVQGFLKDVTDPKKIPYEEIIKKIDSKKGEEGLSDAYLEYYKCYIALMAGKPLEEQNKYLLNMEKLSPESLLTYGPLLADNYYNLGEYDKAILYANRMIAKNRNYYMGHELKFMCYLAKNDLKSAEKVCDEVEKMNNLGGVQTGDYTHYSLKVKLLRAKGENEKALTLCTDALKESEGDVELYRQQAILYLLKGDNKKALESIKSSYEMASYDQTLNIRILNTAVLCAGLAGDDELYDEASTILRQSSYNINKDVLDCLNGKISVKDVFSNVGGSEI